MCTWHEPPRLLDRFTGRMRLEGRLSTRTGLHIGAGDTGDPLGTDLTVVRNAAGDPFIPGSSLKGVIRSAAEALFRSGEPRPELAKGVQLRSCNPLSDPCVTHDQLKKERERLDALVQQKKLDEKEVESRLAHFAWENSCSICLLFGSLSLAGRIRFPDLPLAGAVAPLEIRNGVAIDRDKELAVSGALYDFEAVPPGTDFALTVIVDNPIPAEIGLLLYLFDELNEGHLTLGGKSSRGLGLVRVSWEKMIDTKAVGNPFRDKLARKNLLASVEEEAAPEVVDEAPPALPTTGNADDWALLARLLSELGKVDKNELANAASAHDLTKHKLNERLGLGLDRPRRAWDTALERLEECGFLERQGEGYVLAGQKSAEEEAAADQPPVNQALDRTYQHYLGAMSTLWEEKFQCSPSN